MSVDVGILIEDEAQLMQKIQEAGSIFDLIDEGVINCRGPETDSLGVQMDWNDLFEENKEKLTPQTRDNLSELLNTLFWSWRDDKGVNLKETEIQSDEILDSAWTAATCRNLLDIFEKVNMDEIAQKVDDYNIFQDFSDYKSFLMEYISLLKIAVAENKTLYTLVFG